MQVEVQDGAIRVKRELEDGWFQHVEMPLPAVLTIQSGINKLRYATLMGIKKAKTQRDPPRHRRRTSASRRGRALRIERVYLPQNAPSRRRFFDGDPKEAAAQAGGETEIRGAGHMSDSGRSGTAGGAVEPHVVGDAGRRASSSARNSACPSRRRGRRRHSDAGRRTRGTSNSTKVYARRARAAERLHARTATRRRSKQLIRADRRRRWCCFPHTYQVRDFAPKLATRFGPRGWSATWSRTAWTAARWCWCASSSRAS